MSEQPAAGWYRDPTGRFDHRYWDGGNWTEHVSRNGRPTTDPLDTTEAPADTEAVPQTTPSWRAEAGSSTRTNTKAIASLVLSIIWFGGLTSIPAVVLGVMAKREIRERPGEGGAGVATAGIIIGVIGVVGAVLILIAILAFVAMGGPMFMGMG